MRLCLNFLSDFLASCAFNFYHMENFVILETSEKEKYLEKYSGTASSVEIPCDVVSVGGDAFLGNKNLEKVYFLDGADSIGGYAFSECGNLRAVHLPETLQEINIAAFSLCKSLENVNLPEKLRIIGPEAFSGCKRLKIEKIPDFLIEVSSDSFDDTAAVLQKNEFYQIFDGVMYNEKSKSLLFSADKKIENLKIKNGTKYLGWNCLSNLKKLKNVSVPDSVAYIGRGAFMFCENLEKIILPNSVKAIDTGAFFNCVNLREVIFQGGGLEKICGDAFAGCQNLRTVTLPPECEVFERAFEKCCAVKRREQQQ